jgi:hypothetical protein
MTGAEPTYGEVARPNRAPRDTAPGHASMNVTVLRACRQGGYGILQDRRFTSLAGREFRAHDVRKAQEPSIIVKPMWQESKGSAQEKVPYNILHLGWLAHQGYLDGSVARAYLVLGGVGWDDGLYRAYLTGKYNAFIHNGGRVCVVGLDEFLRLAQDGMLA